MKKLERLISKINIKQYHFLKHLEKEKVSYINEIARDLGWKSDYALRVRNSMYWDGLIEQVDSKDPLIAERQREQGREKENKFFKLSKFGEIIVKSLELKQNPKGAVRF